MLSPGMAVFGQVGLKSQQGRIEPEQVGLSPSPQPPLKPLIKASEDCERTYFICFTIVLLPHSPPPDTDTN